jgi:uncharacterized membrane protein
VIEKYSQCEKMKKNKPRRGENNKLILIIMLIFSLVALIISTLIEIQTIKHSKVLENVCVATSSNCGAVQNTSYGTFMGIKIAIIGMVSFFLYTLILIYKILQDSQITINKINKKIIDNMVVSAGIMAGIVGIYFISLQVFIIKQYCIYCLVVDLIAVIVMILAISYKLFK